MPFRAAIEEDAEELRGLAARIAHSTGETAVERGLLPRLDGNVEPCELERRLDRAALELRRRWLALAHRPADSIMKSPRRGSVAEVPCGERIAFGYERDLDAGSLERRGEAYLQVPPGWTADLVLCRSGQAALATLLHGLVTEHGRDGPLTVAHAGAYFETATLLDSFPPRVLRQVQGAEAADIVVSEPAWCDGQFGCGPRLPAARRALVIDTTLVGPGYDPAPCLALQPDCPVAYAFSSGLKLDQAGLELANVGIVRVLGRAGGRAAVAVGAALRRLRSLVGAGLTLDELSALSAPWFLDRGFVDRYAGTVFEHNAALAAAVGRNSAVFRAHAHPGLDEPAVPAPFCALELRDATADNYRRLHLLVQRESERRGLLATQGGSFGFRGHRFETIEPDPAEGAPFLRVALGWRGGHSAEGLVALFGELAACPSFAALEARYGT